MQIRPCHRRILNGVLLVAAGVALLALPREAASQPASASAATLVAVLPPEFADTVPEGARAGLVSRLVEGLQVARFEVLAGTKVKQRLGGATTDLQCRAQACYPSLARRLRVAYLVVSSVTRMERSYGLTLILIRGSSGEAAAELRERCEICGIEEVGEKMGLAASALRAKLEALMVGPARLAVRSTPPGAYVYLDGIEIGRTPLEREVPGGRHTVRLRHRGFIAAERTLTLVPEIAESVEVNLIRAADTFPYFTVGLTAGIVGLLTVGAGAAMVVIDGNEISCSDAERDGLGNCPEVRDTRALGAILAGVGAAALTGGGLLLWMARDRGVERPDDRVSRLRPGIAPLRGGAQLTLDARF